VTVTTRSPFTGRSSAPRELAESESVESASVTDNWTKSFSRNGVGPMPTQEHAELHRIVDTAHG
jgi:hypothetical protein